ncbi:MAG: polysaccharide pyruvyl transferase family protein [Aeromicrobium sp.]|uniref:polysaccharide pyruvyl transferase family protein n=1 Tax=Aeromicrobium sp. TaxID=1871063 RepID=UPI0039E2829D
MLRRRRSRPERLYVIGVPGHPNFGDEAIARAWLRWLARHRPDAEIWLDTPNPSGASVLHQGIHPRVVFVDTICRLGGWEREGTPQERAAGVERILDNPSLAPRWMAGLEAFHTADRVHLIGGGYLTGADPVFSGLVGAVRWAHYRRGIPVAATGLGMMPMSDELIQLWRDSADAYTVLTVRDESTRTALRGVADLAPDDVFLGGTGTHVSHGGHHPRTVVVAQEDGHDRFDLLEQQVTRLLEMWGVTDDLCFVEANPPLDRRIFSALRDRWPTAGFLSFTELMRQGLPVGGHQQWISTRYHPHLLAASQGARGVALNVSDDYYGVKHAAVEAWGSAWPIIGLHDDPVLPGDPGDLPGRSAGYSAHLRQIAETIYS